MREQNLYMLYTHLCFYAYTFFLIECLLKRILYFPDDRSVSSSCFALAYAPSTCICGCLRAPAFYSSAHTGRGSKTRAVWQVFIELEES